MKIAKKILKWGGISLLLLIIAMLAIPFFFKDTIKEKVIEMANENLKANIGLQDVDISLFKNFPKARVTLNNFVLVNKEPFVGDTLFAAKHIDVTLSIKDLLAGNYNLLGANVKDASVYIHLNKEGAGNFDIAIPSDKPEEESAPIKLDIQQYNVENLKFTFKMVFNLFNAKSSADFKKIQMDFKTEFVKAYKGKIETKFIVDKLSMYIDKMKIEEIDNRMEKFEKAINTWMEMV